MKKAKQILFIGSIILITSISYAEDQCRIIGDLAENIMTRRQMGEDLTEILDSFDNQNVSQEVKDISRELIIDAYDYSEYSTQKIQEKVIRKFKTKVMVDCYKSKRK